MESLRDIKTVSVLLSRLIERRILGTTEIMDFRRRNTLRQEYIVNIHDDVNIIFTGSKSEGINLLDSDKDFMFVDKHVKVMNPGDRILPDRIQKTVLYVRKADCRSGFVNLQLGHAGKICTSGLLCSLVPVGNAIFVSSDIFREHFVKELSEEFGTEYFSSGPSSSDGLSDMVVCFHMSSWPREANQWVTRPRLYGWPTQAMIDKIVAKGCHVVPVGDKCSEDTLLQWRLSFASAERLLVHTFGHIQMKVYCLLKYFLKQMKVTLQNFLGKEDDDILCSYHMKTVMFSALENSHPKLWQEQNLFYCFWFCFNILISCVRVGHFPQYFIPTNNVFQRKVHGQNQLKLLHILDKFHSMKLFCLRNVHRTNCYVNILESVSNAEVQANLRAQTPQEMEYTHDMFVKRTFQVLKLVEFSVSNEKNVTCCMIKSMHLLMNSDIEVDELQAFVNIIHFISALANIKAQQCLAEGHTNKTMYQNLRKCHHRLTLCASMGTYILELATLCFLTGNYSKALQMCQHISLQPSYFVGQGILLPEHVESLYIKQFCGKRYTSTYKLRKTFTHYIYVNEGSMHLPHLHLEASSNKSSCVLIPPQPYALFLSFLCCHELRNRRGRDEVLRHLIMVQTDYNQGVYWVVPTMLGICYETIGDYPRAIRAYKESAKTLKTEFNYNPALERIDALLKYVTQ